MEELYGFQPSGCTVYYDELYSPSPFVINTNQSCWSPSVPELDQLPRTTSCSSPKSAISDEVSHVGAVFQTVTVTRTEFDDENSLKIREQIASHPLYPKLLDAYIGCQKVGAPKEIADLLDEIRVARRQKEPVLSACQDSDPELDNFMESYCNTLLKYKSELGRPFDEAIVFLNDMETQLSSLSNGFSSPGNFIQDEVIESSEEDFSGEEEFAELKRVIEDRELKDKLLQRYSGYLSSLKHEFSKKKKKGKLPKEATQILLEWWSIHLKWPYPTEAEKVALAEWTGLDQKQINNWFINQRKRHWKPTDQGMQVEVLDGLYGPFIVSD